MNMKQTYSDTTEVADNRNVYHEKRIDTITTEVADENRKIKTQPEVILQGLLRKNYAFRYND